MSLSRSNKQSYAIISDTAGTALTMSGDGLPVTVTGNGMTVSNNGTFAVQATLNGTDGSGDTYALHSGDHAHAQADTGVSMLAVRKNIQAALTTSDGNYCPLQVDTVGGLYLAPLPPGSNNIGTANVETAGNVTLQVDACGITSLSGTVITAGVAQVPTTAPGLLGSTITAVDPYLTSTISNLSAAPLRSDKYGSLRVSNTTCTSGIVLSTAPDGVTASGAFVPAISSCANISLFNKITLLGRAYRNGVGASSELTVYGANNAVAREGPSGNLFETNRVVVTDACGMIDMSFEDFAFPFITFRNTHSADACFNLILGGR